MKTTTYEKIRQIRNNTLYPDGVQLEKNVEIVFKEKSWENEELSTVISTMEEFGIIYISPKDFRLTPRKISKYDIRKILGKPVDLQNILRMIQMKDIEVTSINLSDFEGEAVLYFAHSDSMTIELSPPFKDQDEEVGQKLLSLIS